MKITKEELTPKFLDDLVSMSKLASYLTLIGTYDFSNDLFPKSITSMDKFWDLYVKQE